MLTDEFLRALVVFWLLGATDGHAKNFSIHSFPGGRFRPAPLYDVISAQPSVDAGQIRRNQMKLAMALGDSRHYVGRRSLHGTFCRPRRRPGSTGPFSTRSSTIFIAVRARPSIAVHLSRPAFLGKGHGIHRRRI